MATSPMSEVIQHLHRAILRQEDAGLTDGQLLDRFIERRDQASITALVQRHGPMVWGVCHRILQNHHDAEDAFQATFLVLVHKAGSVRQREMVGNFLYGVAHQTAIKARSLLAKRRTRERQVPAMPEAEAPQVQACRDLQPMLDQELSRLPDKYRIAFVLCELDGKTRKEAAQQLGVPEGTVAGRLARARGMLAKRLARHGLAVSGGTLAAVLSPKASAAVPISVMTSTIKGVTLVAAGQAAAAGVISAPVAALTEGVLKTMLLMKLKTAGAVLFVGLGLAALGGGLSTRQTEAAPKDGEKPANRKADQPKVASQPKEAPGKGTLSLLASLLNDAPQSPPMPPEPPAVPPPPVLPEPPAVPPVPEVQPVPAVKKEMPSLLASILRHLASIFSDPPPPAPPLPLEPTAVPLPPPAADPPPVRPVQGR